MKKQNAESTSLYELLRQYPDEAAAVGFFEQRRWGDTPYCPHCGSLSTSHVESGKPMAHRCRDCRKYFSVRTGTVLAESKIPLHKWLVAIYLLHTARKGVSSLQMAREIGVTQKTAWFLEHRIREAMAHRGGLFAGEVEVDYLGGKERNKHESKRLHEGRGTVGKQPLMGILEREGGIRTFPINATDKSHLQTAIVENVKRGSTLYTDSHPYRGSEGVNNTPQTLGKTVDGMIGKRLTYEGLTA